MYRRTFLLGTAALAASCSHIRNHTARLGALAYVDLENLWLRDLPNGQPRRIASGHRIAWPRFSPSGRWIAFQDGSSGRLVPTSSRQMGHWRWNTGESGPSPLNWLGNRDELAVRLADPQSGEPGDRLEVFNASDNWRTPQWHIPFGINSDPDLALAVDKSFTWYAYSSTSALGERSDGTGRFRTTLLLSSFAQPAEPKRLAESAGSFDIAGFTPAGKWLLYWKSDEVSAAIGEDGLNLYAADIAGGQLRSSKISTLLYRDMLAISPTKDLVALTSGSGRETWANKAVAVLDLTGGESSVQLLTQPSAAAQLPAWSPDGETLAWCSGPDAEFLDKQNPLAKGQKTITVEGPQAGETKEIPITPELSLGAEPETIERCLRLRRIYATGFGRNDSPRQLTNDPAYSDEAPIWSADGSHILFCRTDEKGDWTIWLMRSNGSDARRLAGPLRPPSDLTVEEKFSYKRYYGHTEWRSLFDWWRGPAL